MTSFINRHISVHKVLGIFLLTTTVCLNVSCKKMLDIDSGRLANEEGHWNSLEDTRAGLMASYGLMRMAVAENNAHWLWGDLRNGDFTANNRTDLKTIARGDLNASYPLLQGISNWRKFYAVINNSSLFIERAKEVFAADKRYTEPNYKVDIAQARALRAFAYFYMVRIWGDIPLITASHDGTFETKPATDQAKVLAYAESELTIAAKDLPYVYGQEDNDLFPGQYYNKNSDHWKGSLLTKISAYALLAHISAWQSRYIDAAVYTEFIMNNYTKSNISYTNIGFLTGQDGLFNGPQSNQIIGFTFNDLTGESTANGHIEQLVLAAPLVTKPTPDIYVNKATIGEVFTDINDQRFGLDTISGLPRTNYFVNYSGEIPVFSKIKVLRGGASNGNFAVFSSNIIFTRLEELVLLRAEALAVLGQRFTAIELLNVIKKNRGIKPFSDKDNLDLIDEIFAERRRELMGEGWRWYDQIRYQKIKNDNPDFLQLISKKGIYWPVAKEVLNANKMLSQNSYWK
jgi:hypothetical protein